MFNAYLDLGSHAGVTPYVGAGAGLNYVYQKASRNRYFGNSNPYNPVWTGPFNGGSFSAYWDQSRSTRSLQFAWAFMAGAYYNLIHNVAIDLGYLDLDLGSLTSYASFTAPVTQKLKVQEVRLGIRYTPD